MNEILIVAALYVGIVLGVLVARWKSPPRPFRGKGYGGYQPDPDGVPPPLPKPMHIPPDQLPKPPATGRP